VTPVLVMLMWCSGALAPEAPARLSQPRPDTIRTEFRVFDGVIEVSAETRLRVRQSGSTETGQILEAGALSADLPTGLYDVQAVRQKAGQAVNVRWAERLLVMAYPDEGGRHLEVINFAEEHGALQLRWPEGPAPDPAAVSVTVTREGDGRAVATRTVHGPGYALLVLPAGTYDVRVARTGRDSVVLSKVEVPVDGTRMKMVP
jgi:hypothetical protein